MRSPTLPGKWARFPWRKYRDLFYGSYISFHVSSYLLPWEHMLNSTEAVPIYRESVAGPMDLHPPDEPSRART